MPGELHRVGKVEGWRRLRGEGWRSEEHECKKWGHRVYGTLDLVGLVDCTKNLGPVPCSIVVSEPNVASEHLKSG